MQNIQNIGTRILFFRGVIGIICEPITSLSWQTFTAIYAQGNVSDMDLYGFRNFSVLNEGCSVLVCLRSTKFNLFEVG